MKKTHDEEIDFDIIRDSNYYGGKYKIIKDLGITTNDDNLKHARHHVQIQFIDSGSIVNVLLSAALSGKVKDPQFGFNPNKIFQSNNSGPFKMLRHLGVVNAHSRVEIQFINTGTILDVQVRNATDGKVTDPAIKGTSMDYDINRFDNYEAHINMLLRQKYLSIIKRCYNPNEPVYQFYGNLHITMSEEWLNSFDVFLRDVKQLEGYEKFYMKPFLYDLDKDYKQMHLPKELRVYSKDTCMFLFYKDNLNLSTIDYHAHHPEMIRYYGLQQNKAGNYAVFRNDNQHRFYIGTFSNIIAAANAHNYWELRIHNYELVPLLNDVPYMGPEEFIKYNVAVKQMYHLI